MQDKSSYSNPNKPQISEGLQDFINAMIEEIVLKGEPFDDLKKKWLKKYSEAEGLNYAELEVNLSDFFELLPEYFTTTSTVVKRLTEDKAKSCFVDSFILDKIIDAKYTEIQDKREKEEQNRRKDVEQKLLKEKKVREINDNSLDVLLAESNTVNIKETRFKEVEANLYQSFKEFKKCEWVKLNLNKSHSFEIYTINKFIPNLVLFYKPSIAVNSDLETRLLKILFESDINCLNQRNKLLKTELNYFDDFSMDEFSIIKSYKTSRISNTLFFGNKGSGNSIRGDYKMDDDEFFIALDVYDGPFIDRNTLLTNKTLYYTKSFELINQYKISDIKSINNWDALGITKPTINGDKIYCSRGMINLLKLVCDMPSIDFLLLLVTKINYKLILATEVQIIFLNN